MIESSKVAIVVSCFSTSFSLKSDWDVMGVNPINPRNNYDYQTDITSLDDVNLPASYYYS